MISRKNRLSRAVFAVRPSKRVRFEYGLIAFLTTPESGIAVVVPKKVAGSAVVRNKIRRRIYNALKGYTSLYKGGVIIYPSKDSLRVDFEDLKQGLVNALGSR